MNLRNIYKLFRPYAYAISSMIIFSLLVSLIHALSPFANRFMIDQGLLKGDILSVFYAILFLLFLHICDNAIQYFQTKQEIRIANSFGKDLKLKALRHGLKLNPKHYKEQGFYKTIGDVLYDISSLMNFTSSNFLMLFLTICKAAGAAIGLFCLNWRLALLMLPLIFIKIVYNMWMRSKSEKLGKESMEASKNYNTWFSDLLSGVIDIKLWNLYSRKTAEYEEHIDQMNETSKNLSLFTAKNNHIMQVVELAFINLMYLPGAFLIQRNQISFGSLVTFITFSSYLLAPVDAIMYLQVLFKQMKPCIEDIQRFFSLEEENYSSTLLPDSIISNIEFKDVSVTFDKRCILQDVNFKIRRGEKVALVGDNGSGKTTLLNLLLGLCQASSGEVLINGIPIQEYNIEAYRNKISVVSQDIHLFHGTVKENIVLDKETAYTPGDSPAFCTEAIEKLENQFNTAVGSDGAKLSGGEKQKVALLRALNRKATILVLDEASSNYDKESEDAFNLFMKENADYDFYFIVTHRNDILKYADKIIHISHGKIIQTKENPPIEKTFSVH